MHISLAWLNALLEPAGLTAKEAEELLTFVGFPIESAVLLPGGDTLLDVEVTSNRGDCLSHLGVAREVAAAAGRRLKPPHGHTQIDPAASDPAGGGAGGGGELARLVTLENRVSGEMGVGGCPLFTLRLVRGVKVGPSPKWMVERLEAVGQRSINNVVDATNYVLFELGSPTHVFDLARLAPAGGGGGGGGSGGGPAAVIVRSALAGEKLTLLDGKTVELKAGELVVADGVRAVSLAGIMGGADSAVSGTTADVLIEAATWSPGPIRSCARRLMLRSDASHRFERRVDPRTCEAASRRVAELIVQNAGGTLVPGVLHAGAPLPATTEIRFRPSRCRAVLGAASGASGGFGDVQMITALQAQGIGVGGARDAEEWTCSAPAHRPDVRIEEDLIEEVARTIGLDKIPVHEKVAVRVAPPQKAELAGRELSRVLTGLGFFETVTFSFVSGKQAKPFTPPGMTTLSVSDDRRGEEGALRPAILQSLLACRRANQDAKSAPAGTVRLFELASVYAERPAPDKGPRGQHVESRNLGLIADVPATGDSALARKQAAVRLMRGVVEELVSALHGRGARLRIEPGPMPFGALDPAGSAVAWLGDQPLGLLGLVNAQTLKMFDLEHPVVAAEISLQRLLSAYPPPATVRALPAFPAVDRDLSLVVDEPLTWGRIERTLRGAEPKWMEELNFVYTYRGKPLPEGKKSVTLRMIFREPTRTLRDEEVNTEMARVIAHAGQELGAVVRT